MEMFFEFGGNIGFGLRYDYVDFQLFEICEVI